MYCQAQSGSNYSLQRQRGTSYIAFVSSAPHVTETAARLHTNSSRTGESQHLAKPAIALFAFE